MNLRKKITDILIISFLISMVIIVSFFNLISEEQGSENFAGTVLLLILFVCAEVVSLILCKKAISAFCLGYFSIAFLSLLYGFLMEIFDIGYNAFAFVCSLLIAPFYGFIYVSETSSQYISLFAILILGAIAAIICFFGKKERL